MGPTVSDRGRMIGDDRPRGNEQRSERERGANPRNWLESQPGQRYPTGTTRRKLDWRRLAGTAEGSPWTAPADPGYMAATLPGPRMNCLLYARTATTEGDALARQLAELRHVASSGMHVVATFSDEGASGRSALGRPGVRDLLAWLHAHPGAADALLVTSPDRLGRDAQGVAKLVGLLEERGVTVQALDGGRLVRMSRTSLALAS